jgi:hypothetical protein
MIGLAETPLKAQPDVAILTHPTEDHADIRVEDAPEGAADFIVKV